MRCMAWPQYGHVPVNSSPSASMLCMTVPFLYRLVDGVDHGRKSGHAKVGTGSGLSHAGRKFHIHCYHAAPAFRDGDNGLAGAFSALFHRVSLQLSFQFGYPHVLAAYDPQQLFQPSAGRGPHIGARSSVMPSFRPSSTAARWASPRLQEDRREKISYSTPGLMPCSRAQSALLMPRRLNSRSTSSSGRKKPFSVRFAIFPPCAPRIPVVGFWGTVFCRVLLDTTLYPSDNIVKIFLSDKRQRMQDSTLADRLRKLRGAMSRKAFALKYGIHEQSLIRYEKGVRIPDNDIIRRIAEGEEVSFDWLRSGIDPECDESPSRQNDRRVGHSDGAAPGQLVENFRNEIKKMTDMSVVVELQQQLLNALREQNQIIQENADLRIQLERRDQRIRELEKENAQLRESQKGAASIYRSHTGDAG
nr:MAG TPA: helix-turn-helix domain protein [Caudoviricetes sp.]